MFSTGLMITHAEMWVPAGVLMLLGAAMIFWFKKKPKNYKIHPTSDYQGRISNVLAMNQAQPKGWALLFPISHPGFSMLISCMWVSNLTSAAYV